MKEIFLTHGLVAVVDEMDFERLSSFRWIAHKSNPEGAWYAKRVEHSNNGSVKNVYMHRDILGAGPGEEVDHRDGDGLNNTRENLRLCTRGQNNANITRRPRPASGFIGVYHEPKHSRPWAARCWFDGRSKRLGNFQSPDLAARARDEFVRSHWGEFAVLNFPENAA